jgi:ferric-dicitrate binding protein FerR (iron transport regulator)
MNITRDVVIDLLPVYESGEASADTQRLVDEFLKQDTEFARIVRAARAVPATSKATSAPVANAERTALERTRRALHRRNWTVALAIFFSMVPFIVAGDSQHGITFFMWRDEPGSRLFLFAAAWLWWSYFRQTQAMRRAGW